MDESRRRRPRRRTLGGGRSSTETHDGVAEGLDPDLVEDNPTPEQVNTRVEEIAMTNAAALETEEPTGEEEFTPQGRMGDVRTRASAYEREYRLKLLHRMLMRQVPLDKIAAELGVSVYTVMRDRKELYARLRDEASTLNMNEIVGSTMGFYNEIQGMALRTASNAKIPMNLRLAAMRTALSSKNDSHRFLQASGVLDVLNFKSGQDEAGNDIAALIGLTEKLLSDEEKIDSMAEDMGVDTDLGIEEDEDVEGHQRLF